MVPAPRRAFFPSTLRGARVSGILVGMGALLFALSVPLTMGNTGCATARVLKGPGEPCTRTAECQSELTCTSGVCRAAPAVDAAVTNDAGADATPDAATTDDAAPESDAGG